MTVNLYRVYTFPMENVIAGEIYYNAETNSFLTFDGVKWKNAGSIRTGFDQIDDILCERHVGLSELRDNLATAKEKYEAFKALILEEKC